MEKHFRQVSRSLIPTVESRNWVYNSDDGHLSGFIPVENVMQKICFKVLLFYFIIFGS